MHKISICIPTYKRPSSLEKLILSIFNCEVNELYIKDVNIIIVDNDIEKSAMSTIATLQNEKIRYQLDYFVYPNKGLSNVRNELLKKAFLVNPDFIIFIDDDEYVTKNWLNELLKTIEVNKADAVRGPVLAIVNPKTSSNISCWFQRENYPNNTQLQSITTGNLILRVKSLKKFNIWFDNRFNLTGSEDSFFGIQILKKGAQIFWAENATAYEEIPEERANIKWLLKRVYRTTSTYSYFLWIENKYFLIFKKILISLLYLFAGILASIAIIFNYRKKYWGILKIAEGLGGLGGVMNLSYKEYKI